MLYFLKVPARGVDVFEAAAAALEHMGDSAGRPAGYEKTPKHRPVRLAGPTAVVREPVRIGLAGVEIEGRIGRIDGPVLHVKVKATATKTKRSRTA